MSTAAEIKLLEAWEAVLRALPAQLIQDAAEVWGQEKTEQVLAALSQLWKAQGAASRDGQEGPSVQKVKRHKRAPAGYRVILWADGFYHVYDASGVCIGEILDKQEAIDLAWKDSEKAKAPAPGSVMGKVVSGRLAHIRETYNVPAYMGGRVSVNGWPGKIVGARGEKLVVAMDMGGHRWVLHPKDPKLAYSGQPILNNERVQAIQSGAICPKCEEPTNEAGECEFCDDETKAS